MFATLTDFDHPPMGSHIHEIGPLKGGWNDESGQVLLFGKILIDNMKYLLAGMCCFWGLGGGFGF